MFLVEGIIHYGATSSIIRSTKIGYEIVVGFLERRSPERYNNETLVQSIHKGLTPSLNQNLKTMGFHPYMVLNFLIFTQLET